MSGFIKCVLLRSHCVHTTFSSDAHQGREPGHVHPPFTNNPTSPPTSRQEATPRATSRQLASSRACSPVVRAESSRADVSTDRGCVHGPVQPGSSALLRLLGFQPPGDASAAGELPSAGRRFPAADSDASRRPPPPPTRRRAAARGRCRASRASLPTPAAARASEVTRCENVKRAFILTVFQLWASFV